MCTSCMQSGACLAGAEGQLAAQQGLCSHGCGRKRRHLGAERRPVQQPQRLRLCCFGTVRRPAWGTNSTSPHAFCNLAPWGAKGRKADLASCQGAAHVLTTSL